VEVNGFAPVHNGELYYEVNGEGHPLVLIHAGVADHSMWDAQAPVFSQGFRVIRYDTRGYGKSRTQDTEFSNRQDLLDLLNHLQVPAAHVIGISRGGQIAIDFTLEHPERVTALVAVAPGLSDLNDYPEGFKDPVGMAAEEAMEAAHNAGDWERLADLETAMWADGPGQPVGRAPADVRERVRRWTLDSYTRIDGRTTPLQLEPGAIGRLHEIRVPTLVLIGDLDAKIEQVVAGMVASGIPGARKVVVPGVAHMIPLEVPDEFNQIVMSFLQSV
jgi:pimeloyl-ACP methyl ester carboxylesterase